MKTYVHFIVDSDINFTQKHCCALVDVFMLFTMTCSSNNTQNALLCFQYGSVTLQVHGLSCAANPRWTAARLKCRAAPDGVRFARGLNLSGVSWRDSSERIMRLINFLVQSLDILENYCASDGFLGRVRRITESGGYLCYVCIFPFETARFILDGISLFFFCVIKVFLENLARKFKLD